MGALQHLHTRDDTELSSMSGTPTLPISSRPPLAALTRNNSTGHSPLGPHPMERQASSFSAGSSTEQASSFTSSLQRSDSLAQERNGGLTAQDATAGNLGVGEDVRNLARSEASGGARGAKLEVLGSGQPLSRLHSVSVTSLQEQDSLDSKAPPPISIPDSTFAHFPSSHASPPHNNPFLGQPADGATHPLHTPPAGTTAHAHSFPGPNSTAGGFQTQIPTWQPASRSPAVHPNSPSASANQSQNRVRRSSDPLSTPGGAIAAQVPQTWTNPLSSEISLNVQPEKADSSGFGRPLSPRETRITVDSSPRPSRFGQKEGATTKPSGGGDSDDDDGGPLLQAWRSGNLPIEMRSDSTLSRFNKRLPSLRVPHSPGSSKKGQPSPNGSDKITPASKHPLSETMSPDLGGGVANEGSDRFGLESPRPMHSRVFNRTKTSRLGDPRENGMFASKDTVIHKPDAVAKSGLLQKSGLQKSGVFERPTNSGLLKKSDSGLLKKSGLLGRAKTKVGRSGQLPKGGALERVDEDDDSLEDDDVPENWWAEQNKCGWFTILQWVALVLIIALFITSTAVWGEVKLLGVLQWKWLLILLVVVSGRLISGWLVKIVVFILERNFLMKKRVLYFVYSLKSGVQNCLWMGLVTACWYAVMDPKVRDVDNRLQYVTRVILCIFVASALKLAEVLFVKVTASRYHVNRFFERIQDTLFHQHILESLSAPPTLGWEATEKQEEEATTQSTSGPTKSPEQLSRTFGTTVRRRSESGPLGGSPHQRTPEGTPRSARSAPRETVVEEETGKVDIDKLQQLSSSTVSAWSMKRLINLVRYQGISTYSDVVEAGEEINSEMAAKAAARQIFYNIAKPNSRYITIDDLRRFLTGDEVARTWMMFEGAVEKGHITKKSLKAWVVTVYNERRSLSLTLNDTKTVVKKLKGVLDALLWAVIVVVWLTILGIASSNLWVVLSSLLISWVFVFGNMAKTLFEAIVFIFVMHPFDVGDRIEVDGNQMVVEEMNILTTVFLRADNGKTYLPNSVLAQKQIVNMGRSSDMGEAIDFFVDSLTPAEKIAALKERIGDYLKALPHHWYPTFFLLVRDIDKTNNRMQCSFWGQHTMNHQNAGERHTRRGALLQHLLATMRELGINYSIPTQEVRLGGRLEGFGKS